MTERGKPQHVSKVQYQYDAINRLIDEKHSDGEHPVGQHLRYQYDGNNNLIEETDTQGCQTTVTRRHYNALDQLVSIEQDGKNNRTPIIHDTNGRLLQDGHGRRYEYDDVDLLLRVAEPNGKNVYFSYLPNGLLGKKLSGGRHSDFYYDRHKHLLTEYKDHHWTSFIRNGSSILAAVSEQGIDQLYQANQSTSVLIKNDKAQLSTYEGYGERIGAGATTEAVDDFGWNQEYTDSDVNLTFLRHRFYSPETRRFITRDQYPVDNRYAYAKGNPITHIDPTGHHAEQALNYGLGSGFTVLGIVGAIFAVPTGGASLTFSVAAGVGAGVMSALSGISLMGSQAALDSGNKVAAKALQYASISLGALAAVEGIASIAPHVVEYIAEAGARFPRTASFLSVSQSGERSFNASVSTMIDENTQVLTGEEDMSVWRPRFDNVKRDVRASSQYKVDGVDLKAYLADNPQTNFSELNITNDFFNSHQVHQGLFAGLISDFVKANPGRMLRNVDELGASLSYNVNGNAAFMGVTWRVFDMENTIYSSPFYSPLHVVFNKAKNSHIWYFESPVGM